MLIALTPLLALVSALPAPEALPRCGPEVERCAAIRLWIAPAADDFDDLAFLTTELERANLEHGRAGLGFAVVEIRALPAGQRDVVTRADRDQLGHDHWERGLIDVYLVSSLANVDDPGEIRGVHWRSRSAKHRRWVILSRIAPPHVLAHELGHYFGLAHSDVPASLMNTGPSALAERAFQPDELAKIEKRAKALLAGGTVTDPRGPR